jgi:hypothetical protein
MPLAELSCNHTQVSDLSPLVGMPLTKLDCDASLVSDLTLVQQTKLTVLNFTPRNITRGLEALRQMNGLTTLGTVYTEKHSAEEFWKKYDAGDFGKPAANLDDPVFLKWQQDVAALPADKQIEAVAKRLQERNPGFDGQLQDMNMQGPPRIENGVVTEIRFAADQVTDISPLRALSGLKSLTCVGRGPARAKLADLSPLAGLPLTHLNLSSTDVDHLSAIRGLPLTSLVIQNTKVSSLLPLQRQTQLQSLICNYSPIVDLSPLEQLPRLKFVSLHHLKITPASIAALRMKLPQCHIEWDDAAPDRGPSGEALRGK